MSFVYLASPYSHPDPYVRERRYLETMRELSILLIKGVAVYSPIVHCHELAKVGNLPKDSSFWERYNFAMLGAAEVLWILMLEGWQASVGIKAEEKEARLLFKPIFYIEATSHETFNDPQGSRENSLRTRGS